MTADLLRALSSQLKSSVSDDLVALGDDIYTNAANYLDCKNDHDLLSKARQFLVSQATYNKADLAFHLEETHRRLLEVKIEADNRKIKWGPVASVAAIILLVCAVIWIVGFIVYTPERLKDLGDINKTRGFISFIFVIGTMGIAFTMVAALFTRSGAVNKERFDQGKEILSSLIAVLATIIGFYFGSVNEEPEPDTNDNPPGVTAPDTPPPAEPPINQDQ